MESQTIKRSLRIANSVFDWIVDIAAYVAGILVIVMMLIICYGVVMRYFFQRAPGWTVEISEYIIYLIAFLGAAWLLKKQRHVVVDVIVNLLKTRTRMAVGIATSVIGALVLLVIAWFGLESTIDHFQRGVPVVKTLAFPRYILLLFIPLGTFLFSMQFVKLAYEYFHKWKTLNDKDIVEG